MLYIGLSVLFFLVIFVLTVASVNSVVRLKRGEGALYPSFFAGCTVYIVLYSMFIYQ